MKAAEPVMMTSCYRMKDSKATVAEQKFGSAHELHAPPKGLLPANRRLVQVSLKDSHPLL